MAEKTKTAAKTRTSGKTSAMGKKKTTRTTKSKRDIIEFFVDASHEESTVGVRFLEQLNKKGAKAQDIYNLLVSWGYEDVQLGDVAKLLEVYKTKNKVKDGVTQMAY